MPPKKETGWAQLFSLLNYVYFLIARASYKWFLHVYSNSCEIERIIERTGTGAARVRAIEFSLLHSKQPELRHLPSCPVEALSSAVELVCKVKVIPKARLPIVQPQLRSALGQLLGYNQLVREVEWARAEKYDSSNQMHEVKLMELWSLLRPDCPLEERITRKWQEIGFQGDDPATDFRGMGILGLEQLVYLSSTRPEQTKHIYSLSLHPQIGFPFSVAGISMTALTRQLLREGHLKAHLFNTVRGPATMRDFHNVYCLLFTLFSNVWRNSNPASVMEFNSVKDRFKNDIHELLKADTATLPGNILCDL